VETATGNARRIAACVLIAAVPALVAACAGHPPPTLTTPPTATPAATAARTAGTSSARPMASASARPGALTGSLGRYRAGERQLTFTEPAHTGVAGEDLGPRTLITVVWYPLAGSRPAAGPLPVIMFAPGFMQCSDPYSALLRSWASAGYVVAAVDFPRTSCLVADPDEADLVNQPRDVTYALSRLLDLSAQPRDPFYGLLDRHEVGAAGQSDGGDTVAALAANGCCTDHRLTAVAVLSGAEWPPMPGRYFAHGAPPMLFVQGSADTINPPWTSLQLYRADAEPARYYLDLFGVDHMTPYTGTNPVEQRVARVTTAFFDRYLLGQAGALAAMSAEGNASGTAALVSGGAPPP